jgi:hypothetical protein
MRREALLVLMICAPCLLPQQPEATVTEPQRPLAHVSNSFVFTVNTSMHYAAPLFDRRASVPVQETTGIRNSSFQFPRKTCRARCSGFATVATRVSG